MSGMKDCIWNQQLTSTSAGTLPVQIGPDVGRAANTSVILPHASTKPHPSVARCFHQDQLVRARTAGVEHFPLAVLHQRWNNAPQQRHIQSTEQTTNDTIAVYYLLFSLSHKKLSCCREAVQLNISRALRVIQNNILE